jgi:hypothetical protein
MTMHTTPSIASSRSRGRTVEFPHPVVGLAASRHSSRLTGPHPQRGPFAPRALPRFFATMDPSDSRRSRAAVMSSRPALAPPLPPRRVSQVPRLISPHAPSPITPEGPVTAFARCFATGSGLHHSLAGWPPPYSVTRPNRVRLRYGSHGRSARLRRKGHPLPRLRRFLLNEQLPGQPPFRLQDQPGLSWRSRATEKWNASISR